MRAFLVSGPLRGLWVKVTIASEGLDLLVVRAADDRALDFDWIRHELL